MCQATPRTEEDSQREEKKKIRPDSKNREELSMSAAALKEKNRVESPAESLNGEEMIPEWMRYLMRSLREAEERKISRLEKKKRLE